MDGAVFSAGIYCESDVELDSGAGWRGGEAEGWREDCGYRVRAGCVDDSDGEGLSEVGGVWVRLSRGSIELAKAAAEREGVSDRVHFEVAAAKGYPGKDYDLVAFFDCLHDMGDPVGASAYVHGTLKKDGTWMIVEPFAEDATEANHNPIGRVFYSASTMLCVPASMSQEVGAALGAQAGEKRIGDVVKAGGFSAFKRATQTPFNLVFEARV